MPLCQIAKIKSYFVFHYFDYILTLKLLCLKATKAIYTGVFVSIKDCSARNFWFLDIAVLLDLFMNRV